MRTILASKTVKIPSDVSITASKRVVTVTGKRGTLKKSFKHLNCEITKINRDTVRVDIWFAKRKQLACLQTICSHIRNLIKGVQYVQTTCCDCLAKLYALQVSQLAGWLKGYKYKMRAIYAHFPINITTSEGDTVVDIRNFLGEKFTRQVKMLPGVACKHTGVKDEIMVFGNDLEKVSLSSALIHQAVLVKKKDIRKFLDGIYVSEKTTVDPVE